MDNQPPIDQPILNSKLEVTEQPPLVVDDPKLVKQNKQRNLSPTHTAELIHQTSTMKREPQTSSKQTTPKRSSTAERQAPHRSEHSSFLYPHHIVTKVSTGTGGGQSFREHLFGGDDCNCERESSETVSYRGVQFKMQEFLEIRGVIHQKIEQMFSSSVLWQTIMPVKIFSDLVTFVSQHAPNISMQLEKIDENPHQANNLMRRQQPISAMTSLNHSFDSIQSNSRGVRGASAELVTNSGEVIAR